MHIVKSHQQNEKRFVTEMREMKQNKSYKTRWRKEWKWLLKMLHLRAAHKFCFWDAHDVDRRKQQEIWFAVSHLKECFRFLNFSLHHMQMQSESHYAAINKWRDPEEKVGKCGEANYEKFKIHRACSSKKRKNLFIFYEIVQQDDFTMCCLFVSLETLKTFHWLCNFFGSTTEWKQL